MLSVRQKSLASFAASLSGISLCLWGFLNSTIPVGSGAAGSVTRPSGLAASQ